ncbi:unnamed protein product [Fraxinus pennsylvanica]|uniref:BHLH domain-containing protein n=1 Tax=Fraxinus pennsylvanica TaxID=56036 RepID=A0AAD1ZU53_9LAMI|nr:unnamed protein product [Fraxinus pennsylvanica]
MHSDRKYFPQNPVLPLPNQVGSYYTSKAPVQSLFGGTILPSGIKPSRPFHGVDFLTSEACPRNFVIFDKTKNSSQIMFHPEIGYKFPHPDFDAGMSNCLDNIGWKDKKEDREITSFTEDSYDIDALLSTEYENEKYDEDELSTARTDANYGSESSDSCSNYESLSRKRSPPSKRSSKDKKRQKMRKMVKALRGIVPGANQMSTVAVLDEAVKYLKSLRVEVQEIGVGNLAKYA